MSDDKVVVKVLPPGTAEGADDLTRWAFRRRAGKSGVPEKRDDKLAQFWLAQEERRRQKAADARREAEEPWRRDRPPLMR